MTGAPRSRIRTTRRSEPTPTPPALRLSIQLGERVAALPVARAQLRRWVAAALERDAEFTLRFVGSREARALNLAYRGRDYATNVLTFEYDDDAGSAGGDSGPGSHNGPGGHRSATGSGSATGRLRPARADIVVCLPVVAREARAQKKAPRDHLAHLVVHGALHAQGWDHERDSAEADRMEARERAVLARFAISDPYAET